jgi:hypothetical protein
VDVSDRDHALLGTTLRRIPNGPEGVYTMTESPEQEEGEMAGTHDDAVLVGELAKWGAMIDLGDALGSIFADDFDPDAAGINDPPVRTVLNFFETVATLVNNDVLNRELVYDWLWAAGPWDRVGPAARRFRESAGIPALYENFEMLASGQSAPAD